MRIVRQLVAALALILGAASVPAATTQPAAQPSTAPAGTPAQRAFWDWFAKHADRLMTEIRSGDEQRQGVAISEIEAQLAPVRPGLTALLGKMGDTNEIVISAEARGELFEDVKLLSAAAPPIKGWRVRAFKPRLGVGERTKMNYRGERIGPADVWFDAATLPGGGLELTMHVAGLTEENYEKRGGAAVLLLDQALGEYDAATMIAQLHAKPLPQDPKAAKLTPFSELPAFIDARKPNAATRESR